MDHIEEKGLELSFVERYHASMKQMYDFRYINAWPQERSRLRPPKPV